MRIQEGDTVKINTANSMHDGSTGKVVRIFEDEKTCTVRIETAVRGGTEFETAGVTTGFYMSELELVESTGRDGQIKRIRTILTQGDRGVWLDWDDTQAMAEDLYDAGLRFND